MHEELRIIHFPDPRLKKISRPVERIDSDLRTLARRMFELMREFKGVGLAAPQVGVNIRLFVTNHTGEPADDRVYVNPELSDTDGVEIDEEGCLSLPDIRASIERSRTVCLRATDLEGQPIDVTQTGYVARIWQHELDHLNGVLITDRMGDVARMQFRKVLRDLEEQYADGQARLKKRRA